LLPGASFVCGASFSPTLRKLRLRNLPLESGSLLPRASEACGVLYLPSKPEASLPEHKRACALQTRLWNPEACSRAQASLAVSHFPFHSGSFASEHSRLASGVRKLASGRKRSLRRLTLPFTSRKLRFRAQAELVHSKPSVPSNRPLPPTGQLERSALVLEAQEVSSPQTSESYRTDSLLP